MAGFAIALALLAALAVVGARWFKIHLRRRQATKEPGGSVGTAIEVRSFSEIDSAIEGRVCTCGGRLKSLGEGSSEDKQHRYRVVRLECDVCEVRGWIYFDVTQVYQ